MFNRKSIFLMNLYLFSLFLSNPLFSDDKGLASKAKDVASSHKEPTIADTSEKVAVKAPAKAVKPAVYSTEKVQISAAAPAGKTTQNAPMCNSWSPNFPRTSTLGKTPKYFANLNFGVGFVYFNRMVASPSVLTSASRLRNPNPQYRSVVNASLLSEASLAWNLGATCPSFNFLALGITVLNQTGVGVQTYLVSRAPTNAAPVPAPNLFILGASVDLTAVAAKFYFYSPFSMTMKTLAYTPYLATSVGPCWQVWKDIKLDNRTDNLITSFSQKTSANCFFGLDMGFKLRSMIPNLLLSGIVGCKFNVWGQARSMGKASQQKGRWPASITSISKQNALTQPWRVKTVYQWAPYIGFSWAY